MIRTKEQVRWTWASARCCCFCSSVGAAASSSEVSIRAPPLLPSSVASGLQSSGGWGVWSAGGGAEDATTGSGDNADDKPIIDLGDDEEVSWRSIRCCTKLNSEDVAPPGPLPSIELVLYRCATSSSPNPPCSCLCTSQNLVTHWSKSELAWMSSQEAESRIGNKWLLVLTTPISESNFLSNVPWPRSPAKSNNNYSSLNGFDVTRLSDVEEQSQIAIYSDVQRNSHSL